MRPSEIRRLLKEAPDEGLLALMAAAETRAVRSAVALHLVRLRAARPLIDGRGLKVLGYKPGPRFGLMHRELLERQLDGEINSVEEAKQFLLERFPPDTNTENHRP